MTPRRGGIYPMHETSNRRRRDARRIQAGWFSTATFQPARMPVAVGRRAPIDVHFKRTPGRGCPYAEGAGVSWSVSVAPPIDGETTHYRPDPNRVGFLSAPTP